MAKQAFSGRAFSGRVFSPAAFNGGQLPVPLTTGTADGWRLKDPGRTAKLHAPARTAALKDPRP